ncbi:hypothetical protein FHW79_005436 [Azospirillum sp. OGB3]|uniref:hypothetical protein n=1 Tax=Azospirillum sp. OGB3 TaxID=2587012 RepID=UPI0016056454|nr:hypothetical protein [Azospirillum sp. OGB3]MBB3267771.1 hypothetical protein [Azospirillum sp. OGB3]
MNITTIEANGRPCLICKPADADDLAGFLGAVSSIQGFTFTTRDATDDERCRWAAAAMLHVRKNGNFDGFFGIEA